MNRILRRTVSAFFLTFLFLSPVSWAAERAQQVQVTAKIFRDKIKIGDRLRLLVQVDRPRNYSVVPLSEKIDLSPFEVRSVEGTLSRRGENRVQEIFGLTLTVFELGDLKIPAIAIKYKDESGALGEVRTDPIAVKVVSVGKKLTDTDDIRPIKGPVSLGLGRFRNWSLGILAAVLGIFLIAKIIRRWILWRRGEESRKPPHVRVPIELTRLKDQGFLEEHKIKEYYSGLSDILRNYIERALKLEAHERTTFEILQEMKERNDSPAVIEKIKHVLEETDLVKFAKYSPERTLADRLENEILEIVDMTKPNEKGPSS